ncbi:uncharacterized protein LOC108049085 [Drosophila rhopaloa]|uniref:Uncharacterized protein n=1 Tax=Drosophila rhopaloa TaxID=1041015 RepID=A0ABM5HUL2_DRORH|nr:uncharacterized protein LOC108049085 [Drosophila rhopaloa]
MSSRRTMGSGGGSTHTGGPCNPFGTHDSEIIPRPYELMRQRNCKAEKFIPFERYPSIRPPMSRCSYDQTKNWLLESVDQGGCLDHNTSRQDALQIWRMSPHKSLSYYGVADELNQPEAVKFNRALTSSLEHAFGPRRRVPKLSPNSPAPTGPPQPAPLCQPHILNREALRSELQKMPVVRHKLNPKEALETLFCEKPLDPMDPLGVDAASTKRESLRGALDMEKPESKAQNHGLRRNHWYCPAKCSDPENKCTAYEWAKYKLDSRPYDDAFRKWFLEQKVKPTEREPHDYDELYKRFQACFEVKPQPDPDCVAFAKCCADMVKKVKEEGDVGLVGGGGGGGVGTGGGGGGGGAVGGGGGGRRWSSRRRRRRRRRWKRRRSRRRWRRQRHWRRIWWRPIWSWSCT